MIIRFSIARSGGIELFLYENPVSNALNLDSQLISGFMEAIQMFSKSMGTTIQEVKFADRILYMKSYDRFSLRLVSDEAMAAAFLSELLESVAEETREILDQHQNPATIPHEKMNSRILPKLEDFMRTRTDIVDLPVQDVQYEYFPKIGLVGLAKAGKTSIKKLFFENWSISSIGNLKPTIGMKTSRKFMGMLKQNIAITDFGGQISYRRQYLQENWKKHWKNYSLICFVVDIQDPDKFEQAKDYLDKIWEQITTVNERRPLLSILLHKYDPNLRNKLKDNLSDCLNIFRSYFKIATFSLTSIKDDSSFTAMVKSIYLALPDLVLDQILNQVFMRDFESRVYPKLQEQIQDEMETADIHILKTELQFKGHELGKVYGQKLQKAWFRTVVESEDIFDPKSTSEKIELKRDHNTLTIRLNGFIEPGKQNKLVDYLLDGIFTGIFATFYLDKPQMITRNDSYREWNINL